MIEQGHCRNRKRYWWRRKEGQSQDDLHQQYAHGEEDEQARIDDQSSNGFRNGPDEANAEYGHNDQAKLCTGSKERKQSMN